MKFSLKSGEWSRKTRNAEKRAERRGQSAKGRGRRADDGGQRIWDFAPVKYVTGKQMIPFPS